MEEPCLTCDKYSDEKECCCEEFDKYLAYTFKANADEDFTLVQQRESSPPHPEA